MKKNEIDYTLYLCTDRELMSTDTLEEAAEQAIKGGCTVVQLREKNSSSLISANEDNSCNILFLN